MPKKPGDDYDMGTDQTHESKRKKKDAEVTTYTTKKYYEDGYYQSEIKQALKGL